MESPRLRKEESERTCLRKEETEGDSRKETHTR
jgi:hypothetical protein